MLFHSFHQVEGKKADENTGPDAAFVVVDGLDLQIAPDMLRGAVRQLQGAVLFLHLLKAELFHRYGGLKHILAFNRLPSWDGVFV